MKLQYDDLELFDYGDAPKPPLLSLSLLVVCAKFLRLCILTFTKRMKLLRPEMYLRDLCIEVSGDGGEGEGGSLLVRCVGGGDCATIKIERLLKKGGGPILKRGDII